MSADILQSVVILILAISGVMQGRRITFLERRMTDLEREKL